MLKKKKSLDSATLWFQYNFFFHSNWCPTKFGFRPTLVPPHFWFCPTLLSTQTLASAQFWSPSNFGVYSTQIQFCPNLDFHATLVSGQIWFLPNFGSTAGFEIDQHLVSALLWYPPNFSFQPTLNSTQLWFFTTLCGIALTPGQSIKVSILRDQDNFIEMRCSYKPRNTIHYKYFCNFCVCKI